MSAVIEMENLHKRYGSTIAVDDVSFRVDEGEIFGLLGPNGAGKTTCVECLQGLRRRDGGVALVLGIDPDVDAKKLRTRIGSQLQESALPDRLKVWEALDLFAAFASDPVDWQDLLGRWGLADKREAFVGALSGGQRQRLFLTLALVNRPRVVFLDEFTAGLDPQARRAAWDLVDEVRMQGTTVVLVTHYMEEAEHLCDRVAIVDGGRVVAQGSPGDLVRHLTGGTRIRFTVHEDVGFLSGIDSVESVERAGEAVTVHGTGDAAVLTAAALVERGIVPDDFRVERPTLEDVFLSHTGRRISE